MVGTWLEHVLHYQCPEWSQSVRATRSSAGFAFSLSGAALWRWLVSGGHEKFKSLAAAEVRRLGVEELFDYYLACVYSDYERPGGTIAFDAIQGPPWFSLECRCTTGNPEWLNSVQIARTSLHARFSAGPQTMSGELLSWVYYAGGINELWQSALEEVDKLGLEPEAAVLWVSCVLPPGTKHMVSRSKMLYGRFPALADWDNVGVKCGDSAPRGRCRAYPSHIDWNQGAPPPADWPVLPEVAGLRYIVESGRTTTLKIEWNPLLVTGEADLCKEIKALQRRYRQRYEARDLEAAPGLLGAVSTGKPRGGRPRQGPVRDLSLLSVPNCTTSRALHTRT